MFTGIIDHTGTLLSCESYQNAFRYCIRTQFSDLMLGESIAVNGICLTVAKIQDSNFYCDISPETVTVTSVSDWNVDQALNLERAMRASDRFGGHIVQGHVDRIASVHQIERVNEFCAAQNSLTRSI